MSTGRPTPTHAVKRFMHGIRPRVVVGYIALLSVVLVVANVVVRQVLISRFDREIEAALVQEVEEVRLLADGIDPATGQPFGDDVASLFDTFLRRSVPAESEAFFTVVAGEPFLTSFLPPAALLSDPVVLERINSVTTPTRFDLATEVGDARLLVAPLTDEAGEVLGSFTVAYFPTEERAEIEQAVRLVAGVSAVALVLSSVVAWGLAGQVLRPVRQLSDTATSITETDLSARIPIEGDDELARLGATVNSMLDRLERAVTGQRQFLNDIAHDLRTPLTIVQGHLEMLSDDPNERAETLVLVGDELDRMGRYVTDLLVLAKAEQPDFLQLDLVDIGEWAKDLHAKAQQLGTHPIVLEPTPQPGAALAEADADRLTQAMLNLVVNAVQNTEPDTEIRLAVGVVGTDMVASVSDDGPGIDPELLPHLFDRASRGDRSRGARREGTGLGLAIVRAIAEAHGGSIAAVSEVGRGATFTLTIPLDPAGRVGIEEDQ